MSRSNDKVMDPKSILPEFDDFLSKKGESFEAIIVGAGALSIMGVVSRLTRDVDVVTPDIPAQIHRLAKEFVELQKQKGIEIEDDWLNNGPKSLLDILESGWQSRLEVIFDGKALKLSTLGRVDFLGTKLDAMCQRGIDFKDIIAMAPTREELLAAVMWVNKQDAAPGWQDFVKTNADKIAKRLGYAI